MHKERIEKLSSELSIKTDESKKQKSRITTLKNNVSKLEQLSKKPMQINLQPSTDTLVESSLLTIKGIDEKTASATNFISLRKEVSSQADDSDWR